MTQLQNPPVKSTRRSGLPRFSENPETRSVQIGVLGTILLHVLLFLAVPYFLRFQPVKKFTPTEQNREFEIELTPEQFLSQPPPPPKPPAPFKFVETNPDAPDNVPDKTDNFGAQNQQAAQEKPAAETGGDRPATEGKKDFESTQIVSGQLSPQLPPQPSAPLVQETPPEQSTAAARQAQNPLQGFEKAEGEDLESYGTNVARLPDPTPHANERVEGVKDAPLIQGATSVMPRIDPKRPRPAPKLEKRARPAIFAENKVGTQNIGPAAVDAKWSSYGQYLQQLIETVQIQWDRILIQSRVYPPSGTMVMVKFILNKKGEVERILEVGPDLAPEQAKQSCVSAITARSPYGDWTDDMVKVLGESQEMTFSFYYQ